MAEFIQSLDPGKLVLVGTAMSFVTSAFSAPVYNLPIFLFGMLAHESQEAVQSLQAFTFLLSGSMVYDIIWMPKHPDQNWFIRLITILILILKIPTALAFATALRQRGASFSGLGIRGNDLSGPTVWSMPGGFTSLSGGRDGYQNVEDPPEAPKPFTIPPARPMPHPAPAPAPPQAPGAYQSA